MENYLRCHCEACLQAVAIKSLPPGGRWHGEAVTDEECGRKTCFFTQRCRRLRESYFNPVLLLLANNMAKQIIHVNKKNTINSVTCPQMLTTVSVGVG